jgi:uncharacterized protein (DUF486 family)
LWSRGSAAGAARIVGGHLLFGRNAWLLRGEVPVNWSYVAPIVLLLCSNVFMTFAWYGQLNYPGRALWIAVPVSWGIAFFEYCLAVPANRIGYAVYSAAQLKTLQEIITVAVFAVFSATYLRATVHWNHLAAFGCLVLAAFFAFYDWT